MEEEKELEEERELEENRERIGRREWIRMREGERIRMRGERDWRREICKKHYNNAYERRERETSVTAGVIVWGRYRDRNGREDERMRDRDSGNLGYSL